MLGIFLLFSGGRDNSRGPAGNTPTLSHNAPERTSAADAAKADPRQEQEAKAKPGARPDEDRQPKTEIKAPRGTTAKSLDLKALTEGQTGSLPEGDYTIISVSPEIRKDSALRFGTILVRAGTDYLIVSGISPDNLTTWDSWVPEPNAVFTVLKPQPSKVLKDGIPQIVQDPASKASKPFASHYLVGMKQK